MLMLLQGITWGARNYSMYFPIILFAVIVLVYRAYRLRRAADVLVALQWRSQFLAHFSFAKQRIKTALMSVGLLFLFCAVLHPQWNKREQTVAQEGRDVMIALDISRSMLAQDCKPNRLACAKKKIKALVNALQTERVGLMLFSGATTVQCPLTSDYATFFLFLDQVDVETISSGSTAMDEAIKEGIRVFKSMPERKHKLLVLFSDGEDFSSNLTGVKQEAQQIGLSLFTVGVGTPEGAPIHLYDAQGNQIGNQKDQKDAIVISRLNEGILSNLAQDSGGTYLRLKEDDSDVAHLVRLVEKFEKEKFEDKKMSALEEQYPYFLAVSFVCFLVDWLL